MITAKQLTSIRNELSYASSGSKDENYLQQQQQSMI
jgi:hypothetical protein